MDRLPPECLRPRLALLLFLSNVDYQQAAGALDSSRETIRLICLPFSDPRRRVPNRRLMSRIIEWTGGKAHPADFYETTERQAA